MGERVITIVGGKPTSGLLLDLPHPGSRVDPKTGAVGLAKFLLAKVDPSNTSDSSSCSTAAARHELFEVLEFVLETLWSSRFWG